MTDDSRAYRVLLNALSDVRPNTYVHADTLRPAFEPAALTSAEKSGALKRACHEGLIHAVTLLLDDGLTLGTVQVRSQHEGRKSGWAMLYRRTDEPVPTHPCEVPS